MALGYNADVAYNSSWTYGGTLTAIADPVLSVRAEMRTVLQDVPSVFGAYWFYRRLSSGPASQVRQYSAEATFIASISHRTTVPEYDQDRQVWRRKEMTRLRTSDALADLHQGDQVFDQTGTMWAVTGIVSSGIGTIAYGIERDLPLAASPDRKGGV